MNKLITLLSSLLIVSNLYAQNCEDKKYLTKGTKLSFENRNKDGKAVGSDQQEVTNVVKTDKGLLATVKIISDASTSGVINEYTIVCNGVTVSFDIKGILNQDFLNNVGPKGMEMKMLSSENVEFPVSAPVGTVLKDSKVEFQILMQGNPMGTVTIYMKNRKVEASEKITAPAGSFDCLKVSSDSEIVIGIMNQNMKQNAKSLSWIHNLVGPVKMEHYNANGKLESTRVLTKVE